MATTLLDALYEQLPAGLAKYVVVNEEDGLTWTQRSDYPCITRAKSVSPRVCEVVRVGGPPPTTKQNGADVLPHIVSHIDTLYGLYNEHMKADAHRRFLTQVKEFVGKTPGREFVGRKASREIIAYSSAPHQYPCAPDSFFNLCSFLLDAKIHINERVYTWCDSVAKDLVITLSKN